jgi:hypothetical protein
MTLSGESHHVEAFVTHLKAQPYFTKISEVEMETGERKLQFTTNLLKPTQLQIVQVELVTIDEQVIQIELLHPVETRVDEHTRQVTGTSYDIFAIPKSIQI